MRIGFFLLTFCKVSQDACSQLVAVRTPCGGCISCHLCASPRFGTNSYMKSFGVRTMRLAQVDQSHIHSRGCIYLGKLEAAAWQVDVVRLGLDRRPLCRPGNNDANKKRIILRHPRWTKEATIAVLPSSFSRYTITDYFSWYVCCMTFSISALLHTPSNG